MKGVINDTCMCIHSYNNDTCYYLLLKLFLLLMCGHMNYELLHVDIVMCQYLVIMNSNFYLQINYILIFLGMQQYLIHMSTHQQ
jgi:hypothetical protein